MSYTVSVATSSHDFGLTARVCSLVRSLLKGHGDRITSDDPSTVGVGISEDTKEDGNIVKFYDLAGQVWKVQCWNTG